MTPAETAIAQESGEFTPERLRLALVSSDVGLWEWNVQTDAVAFGGLWISLLGLDGNDPQRRGQAFRDLMHPDDLAGLWDQLEAHFRGDTESYAACLRVRHADGHWVWIRLRGRLVERTESGEPLRMVGLYADVTAEKRAECARREAEERFRRSFEQSSVGKCLVDLDGRITAANAAFGALVGWDAAELTGVDTGLFTHPDDLERCRERFQALLGAEQDAERAETSEKRYVTPDGAVVHVLQSRTVLLDSDGRPREVLCLAQDVTDLKRAEEKLTRQEAVLRHKQRMEAVGSLADGIAHEFNNLLQAISGFASFALEGLDEQVVDAPEVAADVRQIQVAADRAAKLTRQMLDFSRRSPSDRNTSLDAREELLALARMIRPLVGERIAVRVEIGEVNGLWEGDRTDVQQALLNLCVNARDAMADGGTLTLSVEQVRVDDAGDEQGGDVVLGGDSTPGAYVRFSVSDTGPGIPPEIRDRIFDPFFTTKSPGNGTGLGLASVYGIAEQHGGRIVLQTGPSGTCFSLDLPLSTAGRAERQSRRDEGQSEGARVLLAEDDPLVRQVAERALRKAGWTPVAVASGDEAVRVFREQGGRFDLLLFDMVMPGLTGRKAYDLIHQEAPDVPVLFCTGYDPESEKQVALCADLPHVFKPISPAVLVAAANDAIGGGPKSRAASPGVA